MTCPTSFFIQASSTRQSTSSPFSGQLELKRKCDLARARSAQHDFGGVVNVSPLRVSLVEQVPSSRGKGHFFGEVVGSVGVQCRVVQELGCIPVVGIAFPDKTQAAAQFKRCLTNLA